MRIIGFSKTKSSATILVDNEENMTYLFTGDSGLANHFSSRNNMTLNPLKKGYLPIFLLKFKSDYEFYQTSGKGFFILKEKDTGFSYHLYSDGVSKLIPFILSGKIPQDEEGYLSALFIPKKIGTSVFLDICDPDDLQLKEGI